MNDDTEPTAPLQPLTGPLSGPGGELSGPLASSQPPPRPTYQQPVYQQPVYQPAQATYGYASAVATRPMVGGVHIAIAWIFAVFSFGYFLPWAIAATRQKSNTLAIGLLNFLVGWTIIGWIAAAVMACMSEAMQVNNVSFAVMQQQPLRQPVQQPQPVSPAPGWYPQGSGQRFWDGHRWTEHTAP